MLETLEQRQFFSVTVNFDVPSDTIKINGTKANDVIEVTNYLSNLNVKAGGLTIYNGPNFVGNPANPNYFAHIAITSQAGNDQITYWGDRNMLYYDKTDVFIDGGTGNDTINATSYDGQAGGVIIGGTGNDTINAVLGICYNSVYRVNGNEGNDTLTIDSTFGTSTVFGGAGDDLITDVTSQSNAAIGQLFSGDDGKDTIHGGAKNDKISGGGNNDLIYAGKGDDLVYGNDGNDSLFGDDGDDELWGGLGNDSITGGIGTDMMYGEQGNDFFDAKDNYADAVVGGADVDTAVFDGLDTLISVP